MTALRNYFNYRRLTKPPIRQTHDTVVPPASYLDSDHVAAPPNPREILLRTALAERALYLDTDTGYTANANPACHQRQQRRRQMPGIRAVDGIPQLHGRPGSRPGFRPCPQNIGLAYIRISDVRQAIHHLDQAVAIDEDLDSAFTKPGAGPTRTRRLPRRPVRLQESHPHRPQRPNASQQHRRPLVGY